MKNSIFRKIPAARPGNGRTGLKRNLGVFDLVMMGIGVTIGSGLFVITGVAAAEHAGPGLVFFLWDRGSCLRLRGALLCGACFQHTGFRRGLYVCIRGTWRNFRVVYRMVSDTGICGGTCGYLRRMVRLCVRRSAPSGALRTSGISRRPIFRRDRQSSGHADHLYYGAAAAERNERKRAAQ